jgi:hypothetical protein
MSQLKEIEGRYYIPANVVMLPVENSNMCTITFSDGDSEMQLAPNKDAFVYQKDSECVIQPIEFYITNDEEINKGEWGLFNNELPIKSLDAKAGDDYKKIIATTDPNLMHYSNNGRVGYHLPLLSYSFIKALREAYDRGEKITKILVEYDKANYDKWLANGASPVFDALKLDKYNTITVKSVKDSYTREELIALFAQYEKDVYRLHKANITNISTKKWLEENL